MSIEHLNILQRELPELFATRELPIDWSENLIIVPVADVERMTEPSDFGNAKAWPPDIDDEFLNYFGPEYIESGGLAPEPSPEITQVLGGLHGGAPTPYTDRSRMPPPDCLAFYPPFHHYHPDWWGVYLLYEGILWLAAEIIRRSNNEIDRREAFAAARLFLYYHEAFHHKVECFAARLELTHREPFYKTGFSQYYRQTAGTADCLEEGLANATALSESLNRLRNPKADKALASYVTESPPGYDQGSKVRRVFKRVRCEFAEKNQRICLPRLPSKSPEMWNVAPHLFDGITNIKSRVNYVLPCSSPLVARLPFKPCLPPSKVVRKLRELVGLEKVREGGRHEIWKTSGGRTVEIPRHPRDLGRGLLRSILRQAGLDMGLDEFLRT